MPLVMSGRSAARLRYGLARLPRPATAHVAAERTSHCRRLKPCPARIAIGIEAPSSNHDDGVPEQFECGPKVLRQVDDVKAEGFRPHPEEPPTGPRVARPDDRLRGVSKDEWHRRGYMVRDGASRLLTMRFESELVLPAADAAGRAWP